MNRMTIETLSDDDLHAAAKRLVLLEREALCELLAVLSEIDARRSYRELGCWSLYEYCVSSLRLSEGAAYRRIRAVRAIRARPGAAALLRQGRLSLEALAILHPHLEDADGAELLERAAGLSTRAVEELVAARRPALPSRDLIRHGALARGRTGRLECGTAAGQESGTAAGLESGETGGLGMEPLLTPPERAIVGASEGRAGSDAGSEAGAGSPAAASARPERAVEAKPGGAAPGVRVAFTADEEFLRLLGRARALTRHKHPDGRLAGVLADALRALIAKKDPLFRVTEGRRPGRDAGAPR